MAISIRSFFPGGAYYGYSQPASSSCTLFGTVWWDGRQYQRQGADGRSDLVAHAQTMIANDGYGQGEQSVISPDGSTWILKYDGASRSVSIYQCAYGYNYGYPYAYTYPLFGFRDAVFRDGFRGFSRGGFRGGNLRGAPGFLAGVLRRPIF